MINNLILTTQYLLICGDTKTKFLFPRLHILSYVNNYEAEERKYAFEQNFILSIYIPNVISS